MYRRGFVLTLVEHPARPHWSTMQLPDAFLSYDKELGFAFAQNGGIWLCLLGSAQDLVRQSSDLRSIATNLLTALQQGREGLHQALDAVAGRYIVVDGDGQQVTVQSDATAARPVYVTAGGTAASHVDLAGDLIGASVAAAPTLDQLRRLKVWTQPGRRTDRDGVLALTPNSEFNLVDGQTSRTWPREQIRHTTPADAAATVESMIRWQVESLLADEVAAIQLTAGLSSRVVLAAARRYRGQLDLITHSLDYQPHVRRGVTRDDVAGASELARRQRLPHRVLSVTGEGIPGDLIAVLDANSPARPVPALVSSYSGAVGGATTVLRGDALSVGRAHVGRRWSDRKRFDIGRAVDAMGARTGAQDVLVESVTEFATATDFQRVADLGFEHADVFEWEQRLARNLGATFIDLDLVADPAPIGNARCVLEPLLSVAAEERRRRSALHLTIERLWPALLELPVGVPPTEQVDGPTVRRRALRDDPERTPMASHDTRQGVPVTELNLNELVVPTAMGRRRFRVRVPANDSRGEGLASLFHDVEIEALLENRLGGTLLVVLHGATDRSKYSYPRFEWQTTLQRYHGGPVLWLAEPLLRMSEVLELGWYIGPAMTDVARAGAELVGRVSTALGTERVVFTGSSGGGFASLSMSRHLPGSTALAFSPQIDISQYPRHHANRFLTAAFPGMTTEDVLTEFPDRLELSQAYAGPTDNRVRIIQNAGDDHHVTGHLARFTAASGIPAAGGTSPDGTRSVEVFRWADGHKPPPRNLFLESVIASVGGG